MPDEPVQPDPAPADAPPAPSKAEAAQISVALVYDKDKAQFAGGIPARDLTVQEATVWLGTPAAVAALCATGGWTPTDALPKSLRPVAAPKE